MKVRMAVSPGLRPFDGAGLLDFAVTAERFGFDTIWLGDVPLAANGDPIVSLASAAAATERLKLGADIVPLGRNPFVLARQLAQLDRQSAGRLLLTFVPGLDQPGERAALAAAAGDRWPTVERYVALLRRWWAGEAVDGAEGDARFDAVRLGITPVQDPLEIWLGGSGPKALARVGRVADGWLTASMTPSEAAAARVVVLDHADRAGREIDPEHFGISLPYAREAIPAETADAILARRARRVAEAPPGGIGDIVPVGVDALRDLLGRHVEAGLSKFVLHRVDGSSDLGDDLAWLADAVLPLQT